MNPSPMSFYYYVHIQDAYHSPGFLYADIPAGLRTLTDILVFFETNKQISHNHAYNFNSFFGVIGGMKNRNPSLNKIIHHDLPMLETAALTNGYLNLLNMAVQELKLYQEAEKDTALSCAAELKVYFPIKFKKDIEKSFKKYGLFEVKTSILDGQN